MSNRSGLTAPAKPPVRRPASSAVLPVAKAPVSKAHARRGGIGTAGLMLVALLAAGVLGGWSFWNARAAGAQPPADAPAAKAAPAFVAAPGLVESAGGLRDLAFEAPGRIKSVLVEEGQAVRKGDLLAELESDEALADLRAAKADLGVAEAHANVLAGDLDAEETRAQLEVERLKAEWDRLKAGPRAEELERVRSETRAAEIEWKRRVEDAKRYENYPSVSSKQDRDMTKGLAEITEAQFLAAKAKQRELEAGTRMEDLAKAGALLKSAEADLARAHSTRQARLQAARQQVEQAGAKAQAAEAGLRKRRLASPIDGVVVWRFRHPGETVGVLPPERILTIADVTTLRVRAEVDEADYAKIKEGQRILVAAEAFAGKSFAGRVERIGHAAGQKRFSTGEAKERQDVKVVETLVAFDAPPPLKLGLRVTVTFELEKDRGAPSQTP